MQNSVLKKLEDRATIYFTLSLMISLSAKYVSEYLGIPFLEYLLVLITVVLITLGVLKVNEYEKQKANESCKS